MSVSNISKGTTTYSDCTSGKHQTAIIITEITDVKAGELPSAIFDFSADGIGAQSHFYPLPLPLTPPPLVLKG